MKPLSISSFAVGYKRTLDHLRAWQLKLPSTVKSVEVTLSARPSRHCGTRLFVYENVPQLKFHNPHVKVNVTREHHPKQRQATISLLYGDGASQVIPTNGLRPDDIKKRLAEHLS